jgi:hypothetical protein
MASKNITKLSYEELQDSLESELKDLNSWGSTYYVEEINRRTQNRLTLWLVAATVVTAVATVANVWIAVSNSCH